MTYDAIDMKRSADKAILEGAIQAAKEEGREEGKREEKKAVAKNMLLQSIDIKIIAEVTGFSVQEVQDLSKKDSC